MDRTEQEPRPDPLVGAVVERYRLAERIAEGSSSAVYRAVHLQTRAEYAMKILYEDLVGSPVSVERFKREAQAASRIKHPNVVSIVDYGTTEAGLMYLVMEMIRGRTLQQHLQDDGVIPAPRAAEIARQIAAGLVEAHARGFVHRDLKPANVMVEHAAEGLRVKILDFGLVRRQEPTGERRVTRAGLTVGTPAYMAPEQCMDGEISGQADLYALGCILYEMIGGRPPFEGSAQEVLAKHIAELPPPLHGRGPIETLALSLLEKLPAHRPKGALSVMRELERIASSFPETVLGRLSRTPDHRIASDGRLTVEEPDEASHTHVDPKAVFATDEDTMRAGQGIEDDGLGASTLSDIPLANAEHTDRALPKKDDAAETADVLKRAPEPRPRTQVLDLGFELERTKPLPSAGSDPTLQPHRREAPPLWEPPSEPTKTAHKGSVEAPAPPPARAVGTTAKVLLVGAFLIGAGALAVTLLALETTLFWPALEVASDPPGASISVDGLATGVKTPGRVKVSPKVVHAVALELPGHAREEVQGPLRLGLAEVRVVWLRFPTPPRHVLIGPVAGKVFVNGAHAGTGTEIALHDLPRDRPITVRVEASGRAPWTRTFAKAAEVPEALEVVLERQ